MRVLHVTPYFYPAVVYGGPTYSVHRLVLTAAALGCDVRVLTTSANGLSDDLALPHGRSVALAARANARYCPRIGRHHFSPDLLVRLPRAIRWADVVHLTAVYSFPTIPTLFLARVLHRPVVWSPRGALQRWSGTTRVRAKAVWERTCQLVAPARLVLHVTSAEEAAESKVRLPGVATVIIPNGVDLPPRLPDRVDARELRLGYLGRLHPKKGLEEALAACQILDEQGHPGWTFTVAGKGEPAYEQQLARRARGLGVADRVKFLGQIDGPVEKQAFFAQLDMLLVPSHTENFGIVVAESLAHGVPVVASRGTPWSELEREGCGLWVDNDPESLANAIARLSRQPVREAGARGRAWMEREYGWAAAGAAMVRLYERLTTP